MSNILLKESDNFDIMYDILSESRDIKKTDFISWSQRRKNYLINENQGFVYVEDTNEIGYFIKDEFHGKGLATMAIKQMLELNPRKYYFAKVQSNNESSLNVIRKLGFIPKGIVYGLDSDNAEITLTRPESVKLTEQFDDIILKAIDNLKKHSRDKQEGSFSFGKDIWYYKIERSRKV